MQFSDYKANRDDLLKREAEGRDQRFKLFEHDRDTGEGRTEGERSEQEFEDYFRQWGDAFNETEPGTPERQQLFNEGLQYRYDNTPDQEPVDASQLAFEQESPYADRFDEGDLQAIRQIAAVLANKNAIDPVQAMESAAGLIVSPNVTNTQDGRISVDGFNLVFNPSLLPKIGELRQRYKEQ